MISSSVLHLYSIHTLRGLNWTRWVKNNSWELLVGHEKFCLKLSGKGACSKQLIMSLTLLRVWNTVQYGQRMNATHKWCWLSTKTEETTWAKQRTKNYVIRFTSRWHSFKLWQAGHYLILENWPSSFKQDVGKPHFFVTKHFVSWKHSAQRQWLPLSCELHVDKESHMWCKEI